MSFWDIAFQVIGGLGIFMIGMRYMSDGLQTVSGPLLRNMISAATTNRFFATKVGLLVTMVVQSSSITTVITVGLVNSGVMKLQQALGVILGANIGTTITGWILVIKIGKYGLPLLGIFAIVYLFVKHEKLKYISMVFMGLGMIFFGLETMTDGFKPIRSMPEFVAYFSKFSTETYMGIMGCALVGCILTCIVQSSSATLGITLALVGTGLIDMRSAAALVLGENIGTTITALLASIGTTTNAKRAAYFHMLFNLIGVFWVTSLFALLIPHTETFVKFISHHIPNMTPIDSFDAQSVVNQKGKEELLYHNRQIFVSSVHSLFNITNVIVFLPLIGIFNTLLMKYVKESKQVKKLLTHLEYRVGDNSFVQIEQSRVEVEKMSTHTKEMIQQLSAYFTSNEKSRKNITKQIFQRENILDNVQKEITSFLTMVMKESLSNDMALECRRHLILADEFESISDYVAQVLKLQLRLEENNMQLEGDQIKEIQTLLANILHCFDFILSLSNDINDKERAIKVSTEGKEIVEYIRNMRSQHWDYAAENHVDALLVTTFADMIVSFRKIVSHLVSSAEAMASN